MPKQRFTTEEIIHKLREADVMSGQGKTVAEICKQPGITDKTYFRWRKSHGGLRSDQAKRMKDLETENARLKKAMAERYTAQHGPRPARSQFGSNVIAICASGARPKTRGCRYAKLNFGFLRLQCAYGESQFAKETSIPLMLWW